MSEIRALAHGDVPVVADMFQRILRKEDRPASPALEAYLGALFLEGPDFDPDLASQVHVRDDGRVSGFLGVLPLRMEMNGKPLRTAVCGTFMVDGFEDDPFAGARLLRAVLAGPQDISISETSNDVSTAMWRRMRATVLPDYSLEWVRVMRPAGFGLELGAKRLGALRLFKPMAGPVDRLMQSRGKGTDQAWSHFTPLADKADAFTDEDATDEQMIELIPQLLSPFALKPDWRPETLRTMLVHARRKANHGERVQRIVRAKTGRPIGLFIYYGDAGRIGRVVQIMALPDQAGTVIDRLLKHAWERGMVAMRGRSQPALLEAMMGRKFAFVHASSTVMHSRQPALVEAFATGQAFFNGFAGEGWTRLIGDRFDGER